MEARHTPGPYAHEGWVVTGPSAAADNVAQDAVKAFDPTIGTVTVAQARFVGKAVICTVYGGNIDEAKANAAFIVRACNAHDDLVKAMHEARQILDTLHYEHSGRAAAAIYSVISTCDAALTKATGAA